MSKDMTVLAITTGSFENEVLRANKSVLMLFRGNEPFGSVVSPASKAANEVFIEEMLTQ